MAKSTASSSSLPPELQRTAQSAAEPSAKPMQPASALAEDLQILVDGLKSMRERVAKIETHEAAVKRAYAKVEQLNKAFHERVEKLRKEMAAAAQTASSLESEGSAGRFELPGLRAKVTGLQAKVDAKRAELEAAKSKAG